MNASAHDAVSSWLMRQLREAAGDVDCNDVPDVLERLAARIEQRAGGHAHGDNPVSRERALRK